MAFKKAMKHDRSNHFAPWLFSVSETVNYYCINHIFENSVSPLSSLAMAA